MSLLEQVPGETRLGEKPTLAKLGAFTRESVTRVVEEHDEGIQIDDLYQLVRDEARTKFGCDALDWDVFDSTLYWMSSARGIQRW